MDVYACHKCGAKLSKEQLAFLTKQIKVFEHEVYTLSDVLYRICHRCNQPTSFVPAVLEKEDILQPPREEIISKAKMLKLVLEKAQLDFDVDFITRWLVNHYKFQKLVFVDEGYIQKIVKEVVL